MWITQTFLLFGLMVNVANAAESLTESMALKVGVKIWYNESGGSVAGLTNWGKEEGFASLGIGHFIWYPDKIKPEHGESFSHLLKYFSIHGVNLPPWLRGDLGHHSPWRTRESFRNAGKSKKMAELRQVLVETIPLQAQFMVLRLAKTLPKMLWHVPEKDRNSIKQSIQHLMASPKGVFAMVDYLNFKGAGLGHQHHDWGLLQVLRQMQKAPGNLTSLEAFVWAADVVLAKRVLHSAKDSPLKKWANGWHKRLYSYL